MSQLFSGKDNYHSVVQRKHPNRTLRLRGRDQNPSSCAIREHAGSEVRHSIQRHERGDYHLHRWLTQHCKTCILNLNEISEYKLNRTTDYLR